MLRVIFLIMGYCCGLLQTGYLYGRLHGIDIRNSGSGNSGATNTLRVLGKKAGAIVFFGDFLKCLIPSLIVFFAFRNSQLEMAYIYMMYMVIGVILGHNYPFYLEFKGGKGIACTAGVVVALDWRITLVCLTLFILTVAFTRYVSLGSLLVVTALFLMSVLFGETGLFYLGTHKIEFYVLVFFVAALAFWRHRANISRLIKGTENKIGSKKKE